MSLVPDTEPTCTIPVLFVVAHRYTVHCPPWCQYSCTELTVQSSAYCGAQVTDDIICGPNIRNRWQFSRQKSHTEVNVQPIQVRQKVMKKSLRGRSNCRRYTGGGT